MSDLRMKSQLVETSCSLIMNTVRSLPLNYNIVETPYSIYLTLRKSILKSTQSLEMPKVVNQDDKVRKLEEANANLSGNLEEAVIECEENAKTISELKETAKNLLDKLDKSEKNNLKMDALKDEEIECIKMKKLKPCF